VTYWLPLCTFVAELLISDCIVLQRSEISDPVLFNEKIMASRIFDLVRINRILLSVALFSGVNIAVFSSSSGRDERGSFMHKNLERTYIIHFPDTYVNSMKVPLVIALHGRGGEGSSMILVTKGGFSKLSDRNGFIVVYPDGIAKGWNDGRIDEEANDRALKENIDDVGFLSALIDRMIKDYNVDPQRVYVTGISNGAIMSYRLACELSGKIAAIAPVDGNIPFMLLHECFPSSPVSVLAINNVDDPLVPFEGGEIMGHFKRVKLGKVLSVNESISFWVRYNSCSDIPLIDQEPDRDPEDGTRVLRKEFTKGRRGTEVILYKIDGGGHTWPGGLQYLPAWLIGKTSRDIDACTVIWNFFSRHSK
jgi:polyhydroxybutyrate depolymerase